MTFFAIDAEGGAVIIETHNHGYTRHDAASFPGERLPNTNFSRSGGEHKGSGYLRFDRENELLKTIPDGRLEAGTIFRVLAREYFNRAIASKYSQAWAYRAAEADVKRLDAAPPARK